MIRILIVDDQQTIRETLKTILATEVDLQVVGAAQDGTTALEMAKNLMPDLMLVDLEMPGLNGLGLTRLINQDFPSIKVIVLSMHDRDEYIHKSIQSGAMGYLLKNTPAKDLKEAIRFVQRGYTQFSPGLLHRAIPTAESPATSLTQVSVPDNAPATTLSLERFIPFGQAKSPRRRKNWKSYLPYWLGGNVLLWSAAILYLIFKSPTYVSQWSVSLPANENSSSVNIPDVGSLSSDIDSPYRSDIFDPRENYKYLLKEKEILTTAAAKLNMKRSEFGKPEIEIVDNTTMMEISMEGDTPELAREKAITLQTTLEQKLEELRQGQIGQSAQSLAASLEKSRLALAEARGKLADFRANSAIGSSNKANNLSENLENLRRQEAEAQAELQQTRVQAQNLANNLGLSSQSAKDAFALHSDSLFQQYLAEYTRSSGEMVALQAKFQTGSPLVGDKQSEVAIAYQALLNRGSQIIGRSFSPELLQQLNLRTGNENNSYRGGLLQDLVSLQSQADGLEARAAELAQQVNRLEQQENIMVRQESTSARLRQEVKFAETLYSSNLAKSRLAESNLYDAYPQIQVAFQPSLAKKPSSPDPVLVGLGTFMASVFYTTAIASFWASSTTKTPRQVHSNGKIPQAMSAADDLNSLIKK
ncbi:MAG: response regulator [Cyanobacteria bacterium P01_C01_bin.72]